MSHDNRTKTPATAAELQKIGFNESVDSSLGCFHVQTEVVVRDRVVVKTTVLDGGVVRFVDTQTCSVSGLALQEIEAIVVAQHRRNVERVTSGAAD